MSQFNVWPPSPKVERFLWPILQMSQNTKGKIAEEGRFLRKIGKRGHENASGF